MMEINEIRDEVKKIQSEERDFLKKLCSIDSGSKDIEGINKVADTIVEYVQNKDFKIERIDTNHGPVLVLRLHPGKGNKVLMNAHMDTVFNRGDNLKYPVHEENDYFYGLGSSDCKGGVTVSLFSLLTAMKFNLLKENEYTLVYACDEEIGSTESKVIYEKEAKDAKCALVFEPARGNNGIIVSRRSCVNATIEVFGKSAHSSEYEKGANAVLGLSNIIQKLNKHQDSERNIYINIGDIHSDGPVNKVCDHAWMEVSCRVENKSQADEFFKIYKDCADPEVEGCTSKVTLKEFSSPLVKTKENMKLYELARKAGEMMGEDLKEINVFGSSDASKFSGYGLPTIDALGPYTYGMHVNDEHTSKSSIEERTLLAVLLLSLI